MNEKQLIEEAKKIELEAKKKAKLLKEKAKRIKEQKLIKLGQKTIEFLNYKIQLNELKDFANSLELEELNTNQGNQNEHI